jgi:protein phosphatase
LALVADGMGGPPGGAQASQIIIDAAITFLRDHAIEEPGAFLRKLFVDVDQTVLGRAREMNLEGMGSTCTLLMALGGTLYLGHVGDSRCYLVHRVQPALEQWSEDHNVAARLVAEGVLTPEEARHHRSSHALVQAMGLGKELEPQIDSREVPSGETMILLCSDGLLRVLEEPEVLEIICRRMEASAGTEANPLQAAADQLVDLANRRGSPDNVSIMLLRFSRPA